MSTVCPCETALSCWLVSEIVGLGCSNWQHPYAPPLQNRDNRDFREKVSWLCEHLLLLLDCSYSGLDEAAVASAQPVSSGLYGEPQHHDCHGWHHVWILYPCGCPVFQSPSCCIEWLPSDGLGWLSPGGLHPEASLVPRGS